MVETLTESFCERCGNRFAFEPPPKPKSLTKLRVLSRGLRSYVLTDGSSFGDVLSHARSDEERQRANVQLDQFHQTFKFCMACRQYTCSSCWNGRAGQCLSCAPVEAAAAADMGPTADTDAGADMGPTADTDAAAAAGTAPSFVDPPAVSVPPPDVAPPPVPAISPVPALSPVPAISPAAAAPPAAVDAVDADDGDAIDILARLDFGVDEERRSKPVDRTAFGRSTVWTRRGDADADPAVRAVPQPASPATIALPTRPVDGASLPQPSPFEGPVDDAERPASPPFPRAEVAQPELSQPDVVRPASESIELAEAHGDLKAGPLNAAGPWDETWPPSPMPDSGSGTPPPPEISTARAAAPAASPTESLPSRAEQIWWIVAPEAEPRPGVDTGVQPIWPLPTAGTPARPTRHSDPDGPSAERQPPAPTLSSNSIWPTMPPRAVTPAHVAIAQVKVAAADSVWAASSRDVLNRPGSGAQACVSCGLALSAVARFCRRCGSPQS